MWPHEHRLELTGNESGWGHDLPVRQRRTYDRYTPDSCLSCCIAEVFGFVPEVVIALNYPAKSDTSLPLLVQATVPNARARLERVVDRSSCEFGVAKT